MLDIHKALNKCQQDLQEILDLIQSWCQGPILLQRQDNEIQIQTNVLPHLVDVLDISSFNTHHSSGILNMDIKKESQTISYDKSMERLSFYQGEPSFEKAELVWKWTLRIFWFHHEDLSQVQEYYISPMSFQIISDAAHRYITLLRKKSHSNLEKFESTWNPETPFSEQGLKLSLKQGNMLNILHESLYTLVKENENVLLIPNYKIFISKNTFYITWKVLYLPSNFLFNTYTKEIWIPGFEFQIQTL